MLNYSNLNDIEFEELCQDVMSRKLNIVLRRFAPGQDGGIDLKDNTHKSNIIVQVKHYINSSASQLIASLKKEVPKVITNRPSQYYVCCALQLTPKKIGEIYSLFSDYMKSEENVVTLSEINDFLVDPNNVDILKKHYKLWLSATSILEDIFTKDICIDCETLLANIQEEERLFVQTSAYNHALKCLSKNRCLLITGNPGVGKTITSKMLILYFAAQGYKVRYTTDGTDLGSLKRALSSEKKEIILLDDCLGQAYFNMKETQGNELLAIIRYVKNHTNKILILNSRVTIYQEARVQTPELVKSFDTKEFGVFMINMDVISDLEKAKILYNHLYFKHIKKQYFDVIKKEKNYLQIIKHKNYNPRIIEFVTNSYHISNVSPDKYYNFILQNLNDPSKAWEDEYVRRLKFVDRILLTTLYSITNTTAPYKLVKECFEHRIEDISGIDYSINNFTQSLNHLLKSFVTIVDVNSTKMLSMSNPSVNDFITSYLSQNQLEMGEIISKCCSVAQYKRMVNNSLFTQIIDKAFNDNQIIEFVFENAKQKADYITYYISTHRILDKSYISFVQEYLSDINNIDIYEKSKVNAIEIIDKLVEPSLFKFYHVNNFFYDIKKFEKILSFFDLKDLIKLITIIDSKYHGEQRNLYIELCQNALENAIEIYYDDINADEFDIDIENIIKYSKKDDENYGSIIDMKKATNMVYEQLKELVLDEIANRLLELPIDVRPSQTFVESVTISVMGCEELIYNYINDYDDTEYDYENRSNDILEITLIFDR